MDPFGHMRLLAERPRNRRKQQLSAMPEAKNRIVDARSSLVDPAEDRWMRRVGIRAWAWIGVIVLAGLIFLGLALIADFVVPLVVAVVLGMVFAPLAGLLARFMPQPIAAVLVLIGLGVVTVTVVAVIVVGIIDQAPQITAQLDAAVARAQELIADLGLGRDETEAAGGEQLTSAVGEIVGGLLSVVPSAFSSIGSFLAGLFVAVFLLYYMLAEWKLLTGWVGAHLGVPADLGAGIVEDATRSFRDYFYVLTIASLPVAVSVGLAAALMSLPLAFTMALVTFITSYIPYIGALVSAAFALVIAFGAGGVVPAVVMLIVILVAQNVVQPLIQRRLERNTLNLHPIVSFGSTMVGSVVAGVLGATLSAPFVAMVVRAYERIRDYRVGGAVDVDPDTDDAAAEPAGAEPV